jgi:pimeloyl-ACP methyl ester carboxylesterase
MKRYPALESEAPSDLGISTPIEHRWIDVGEVRLHVALAGPEDGNPLILLHGFPEAWFGWGRQIEALAGAGFRLAMPDQRGYNLSEKPAGVACFGLDRLADDIVGLAAALGWKTYGVVGHDWGAAVTWQLVHSRPTGLVAASVLNVPEPRVMLRFVLTSRQFFRSWYVFFFQLPWLPEWLLRRSGWAALSRVLAKTSTPGTFSEAELARYRKAWNRPGAITAMLSWYRAAVRTPPPRPADPRVTVPMLILWGELDSALGKDMVDPSAALVDDVRVIRFPHASHWVQHEEATAVNEALIAFFSPRL